MKKPNITEGNWQHWEDDKTVQSDLDNETLICEVDYTGTDPEEESANAKAISAVPEMIDALSCILESHDNEWHIISSSNYELATKALKKAGCTE